LNILPDVGHAWNELGYAYSLTQNWAQAYRYLKPFVDRDMVDDFNLPSFGFAALDTGQLEEAEEAFKKSYEIYPKFRAEIVVNQGVLSLRKALKAMAQGQFEVAERLLAEAREVLLSISSEGNKKLAAMQRENLAFTVGLSAELLLRRGQTDKAIQLYREALRQE